MPQNISEKILSLLNCKIFCLGDLKLDNYVIGNTNRISPEGPIPILDIKKDKFINLVYLIKILVK